MKGNNFVKKKLFSVIIPAYNREAFISEALNSVKKQSYRPVEIIVIDDGSTDNTKDVVLNWRNANTEKNQLSLRYFYQDNLGAGASRNVGISKANGEYVQFLDSDDLIYPERLKILAETFEKEECDFIQTGFERVSAETGEVISIHYGRKVGSLLEQALRGVLWGNTLRASFKRELIDRAGLWNTDMSCFEDREYVERVLMKSKKPVVIRDILASARRGDNARISDKLQSYEGRAWRIYCEKCLADATRNRKDISYKSKQAFASRIYALGLRSNAAGWLDLGKECGEIAESMNVKLDLQGKKRRLVWKMGRVGGVIYDKLSKLKQ